MLPGSRGAAFGMSSRGVAAKRPSVYRWRAAENNCAVSPVSTTAHAHNVNAAAVFGDDRDRHDEEHRHAGFPAEPRIEVEHLRLDGDVERVVGSSAMSSCGPHESPTAIITRLSQTA